MDKRELIERLEDPPLNPKHWEELMKEAARIIKEQDKELIRIKIEKGNLETRLSKETRKRHEAERADPWPT